MAKGVVQTAVGASGGIRHARRFSLRTSQARVTQVRPAIVAVPGRRSIAVHAEATAGGFQAHGRANPIRDIAAVAQIPAEEEYVFEMEIPRPPFVPETWPPEAVLGGALAFIVAGAMTAFRAPQAAKLASQAVTVLATSVGALLSAAYKSATAGAEAVAAGAKNTQLKAIPGKVAGAATVVGRKLKKFGTLLLQVAVSLGIAMIEGLRYFKDRFVEWLENLRDTVVGAAGSAKASVSKFGGGGAAAAAGSGAAGRAASGAGAARGAGSPRGSPVAAAAPVGAPPPPKPQPKMMTLNNDTPRASSGAKEAGGTTPMWGRGRKDSKAGPDPALAGLHVVQMKTNLLRCVAGLDRGFSSGKSEQDDVERACGALEFAAPPPPMDELLAALEGSWQLIYSSAFAPSADPSLSDINSTGVTTPLVAAGKVWQDIYPAEGRLENIVTLKGPSVPFLPPLETKVHLGHLMVPEPPHSIRITTETATVDIPGGGGSTLPAVSLPDVADSFTSFRDMRSALFTTVFVDDDMRISRGEHGELWVYTRDTRK